MQELLAVALILAIVSVPYSVAMWRLLRINQELGKLLASRNFSEYAAGEARIAKASVEQKKEPSYETAFEED